MGRTKGKMETLRVWKVYFGVRKWLLDLGVVFFDVVVVRGSFATPCWQRLSAILSFYRLKFVLLKLSG